MASNFGIVYKKINCWLIRHKVGTFDDIFTSALLEEFAWKEVMGQ
jgi:hypothetical protein